MRPHITPINVGIVSPTSVIRTYQCSEGKGSNISIISFQGCISWSLINRQLRNHGLPTESLYKLGPCVILSSASFQRLKGTLASGGKFHIHAWMVPWNVFKREWMLCEDTSTHIPGESARLVYNFKWPNLIKITSLFCSSLLRCRGVGDI